MGSYVAEPLRLGDLYGNRFDIVLRNVHGDDEQIASSITELQTLGFINYFGMQRFGTAEISTDRIGLAILKSDWQQAVELIMSPAGVSFAPEAEAREFYLRTHVRISDCCIMQSAMSILPNLRPSFVGS